LRRSGLLRRPWAEETHPRSRQRPPAAQIRRAWSACTPSLQSRGQPPPHDDGAVGESSSCASESSPIVHWRQQLEDAPDDTSVRAG